ncbi:hypothetical protein SAY87_015091 [Trapa incisa]|uniref:Uncharacterized protein n=1 Tax=Trapa incisa TaxID=236973 RepID=A0AAN7GL44_9MYRT|nr:hypothetical protein SAY87_015091 [Trapa incisa]
MEAMRMKHQLPSKDKVEDDKKRKRGLDDQGNHGHGTKDITVVLAKRPRLVWTSYMHQKFLKAIEIIHKRKTPHYFSNINQQLVPPLVAPTTKQFIFPRNLSIQPLKPLHTSIGDGPGQQ